MATKKKKTSEKKDQYALQLTRKELLLWFSLLLLAVVWVFALGVIVGRGHAPVKFNVGQIENELLTLKQEALKKRPKEDQKDREAAEDKRYLDFYHALTEKKERARDNGASHQDKKRSGDTNKKDSPTKLLTLQLASLTDRAEAQRMVDSLKKKGYSAYIMSSQVSGKVVHYRVRVGHFKTKNDAAAAAKGLRQAKLEPIITAE